MREFLEMGGYTLYVWTSYGIAAAVLVANFVLPLQQRRRVLSQVARRQRRERRSK